jgi:hypothetical protein
LKLLFFEYVFAYLSAPVLSISFSPKSHHKKQQRARLGPPDGFDLMARFTVRLTGFPGENGICPNFFNFNYFDMKI